MAGSEQQVLTSQATIYASVSPDHAHSDPARRDDMRMPLLASSAVLLNIQTAVQTVDVNDCQERTLDVL